MRFFEKVLLISVVVIWISVIFKYETIAFLSRSRSSSGSSSSRNSGSGSSSSGSGSQHRIRQSISNTIHRISDKIHHRNDPKPKPPDPPKPPPVPPSAPKPPVPPPVVVPSAPKPPIVIPSAPKPDEKPPPYNPQLTKNQGGYNPKVDTPPPYDSLYKPKPYPNQPVQPQPYPQQPVQPQPYPQQPGSGINQNRPGVAPYPQNPYNPGPAVYPQQPYNPGPGFYPQQPYYPPPQKPNSGVFGGSGSYGSQDKLKTAAGALVMSSLAKKIFSSGRHMGGQHNYRAGMYHNYNYRPDRYGSINGDTCTNNYNYDGIIYGQFICPIDGFGYDATRCCGAPYEQYCCTPAEYAAVRSGNSNPYSSNTNYNNNNNVHSTSNKRWDAIMISIVVAVIVAVLMIVSGVMILWYCKKRVYNRVPTQQTDVK